MDKYVCPCGYVYDPAVGDPDNGVAPGTPWDQVPESWVCPVCERTCSRRNKRISKGRSRSAPPFFAESGPGGNPAQAARVCSTQNSRVVSRHIPSYAL